MSRQPGAYDQPHRRPAATYAPPTRGGLLLAIVMMAVGLALHAMGVLARFDPTAVILVSLVLISGLPRVIPGGRGWWRARVAAVPAAVVYASGLLATVIAVSLESATSSPAPVVGALAALGVLACVGGSAAVTPPPGERRA